MQVIYSAINRKERATMTRSVYVRAKSKVELNARLDAGHSILARSYYPTGAFDLVSLVSQPHGTIVRIYHKTNGSSPIVKAYCKWDANKRKVL